MIYISNIKIEEQETYLFIYQSAIEEIRWLLTQAGCSKDDFHFFSRHMVLKNKVEILKNVSKEERDAEIEAMYGEDTVLKDMPAVLVSHFNKEELFHVLKPILVDGKTDPDYWNHVQEKKKEYKRKNEKSIYVVKKGRKPGIYLHWLNAYEQIRGLKDIEFYAFPYDQHLVEILPSGELLEGAFLYAKRQAVACLRGEDTEQTFTMKDLEGCEHIFEDDEYALDEYYDDFEEYDDDIDASADENDKFEKTDDDFEFQDPTYPAFELEQKKTEVSARNPVFAVAAKVTAMGTALGNALVGQDEAIRKFENAYFNMLKNEQVKEEKRGPKGVFLFAGPPGVGKTYMAELIARNLNVPYKRFDMSGYSYEGSVIGIVGLDGQYKDSKPGEFTGFVKSNPECVILFDEIEKAHMDVIRVFLRMLDEGICVDEFNKQVVDCRNIIVFFTTNAGKQLYVDAMGENLTALSDSVVIDALEKDMDSVKRTPLFPPEIISRFASNTIIMFNHLPADSIYKIIQKDVSAHLAETQKSYHIELSSGSSLIAQTVMYSLASNIDARKATKLAGKLIDKQIYELICMVQEKEQNAGLNKIGWKCDLESASDEVKELYYGDSDPVVIVFGDVKEKMNHIDTVNNVSIKYVTSVKELREMLQKDHVYSVLIQYEYGMFSQKDNLSILDIPTKGKGALKAVCNETSDIPVYVLCDYEDGYTYSYREKQELRRNGVEDFIGIKDIASEVEEIFVKACCRQNAKKLISQHNVLKFETRKEYHSNTQTGDIVFYNLHLERAIEAEDKSALLTDDLRPNVRWSDICVSDDVKNELMYFIDYLQNPKEYVKKGVSVPKGALMYGPPGTGKTSLAKVVATESSVNFINTTGADLMQSGSRGVEKIFRQARKYAPAVLFIDEIDAIGLSRNYRGSNDALNTLLTEMDGFIKDETKPVFVMAATNMGKELDAALLRRFDRTFEVGLPGKYGRKWILERLLNKHSDTFEISESELDSIVNRSGGLSPAALGNIIEAALRESIRTGKMVTDKMLDDIFEKIIHGESKAKVSEADLMHTAYHEAGHAVIELYYGKEPEYMSVVSRRGFLGYVLTKNNNSHPTKENFLHDICSSLGGRAAELEFNYGLTPGAAADLAYATKIAVNMVCKYGMYEEEIGLAVISEENIHNYPDVQKLINQILGEQLKIARKIVNKKRNVVETLVKTVCEKKYLTKEELATIYNAERR